MVEVVNSSKIFEALVEIASRAFEQKERDSIPPLKSIDGSYVFDLCFVAGAWAISHWASRMSIVRFYFDQEAVDARNIARHQR